MQNFHLAIIPMYTVFPAEWLSETCWKCDSFESPYTEKTP